MDLSEKCLSDALVHLFWKLFHQYEALCDPIKRKYMKKMRTGKISWGRSENSTPKLYWCVLFSNLALIARFSTGTACHGMSCCFLRQETGGGGAEAILALLVLLCVYKKDSKRKEKVRY